MNSIQQFLATFVASTIIFSLNSCTLPSSDRREASLLPSPTPVREKKASTARVSQPIVKPPAIVKSQAIAQSITANIYQVDSQCQALIRQTVTLPAQQSLEAAVGKVLEQSTGDLNLGYRVSLDRERRVVTVDLRIPAHSPRRLTSLSSCEQLALFGSLRQTLTSNRLWQIKNVRFTSLGEEIWL